MFNEWLEQLHNLNFTLNFTNIAELAIIAVLLLAIYLKFIKKTSFERFIKGILVLCLAWIFSDILIRFDLKILGVFIQTGVMFIALSLIVIFQPELRRLLASLGQGGLFNEFLSGTSYSRQDKDTIKEVLEAVKYLSKNKIGALIVFQNKIDASAYFDVGTKLNADVSTELILTIFHPKTPLHDGAMVIQNSKILSAGVLLPLTEDPKLSWKYGTRHRAAIGTTELSDSACLVVSEETGDVSMSMDGALKKYEEIAVLKTDLENILGVKSGKENKKTVKK